VGKKKFSLKKKVLFWGFLILENQQTSGFGLFENSQNLLILVV
jgi:hypothetical protein